MERLTSSVEQGAVAVGLMAGKCAWMLNSGCWVDGRWAGSCSETLLGAVVAMNELKQAV